MNSQFRVFSSECWHSSVPACRRYALNTAFAAFFFSAFPACARSAPSLLLAMSKAVQIPPELAEVIRDAAGVEPDGAGPAKHFQVGADDAADHARDFLTPPAAADYAGSSLILPAAADTSGEAGAGGRVLPQGVRAEDGPARDVSGELFTAQGGSRYCYQPLGASYDGPLLAFDIETTGLTDSDTVTCVCGYDPARGVHFGRCTPAGEACEEFLALLDAAPLLCAFNGVRFDVPFLARRWSVPAERAGSWVRKLIDPYEACKLVLGKTFSLDKLLAANGIACKTASGLEAVEMARGKRWDELLEYCMHDTVKTHQAVAKGRLVLPG